MTKKEIYQLTQDKPWSQSTIRRFRASGLSSAEIAEIQRICHLRQARAANRPLSQADLAIAMKLKTTEVIKARYRRAALAAIQRNIDGCTIKTTLDLARAMALVTVEGWAQYSRKFGARYTKIVILVVYDHDTRTRRALRVGPSVRTIDEALDYVKPAPVRRAEAAGKQILRQGDFYFVPARRADYSALAGSRHEVRDGGVVWHPEHGTLTLPGPHRAYRQMAVVGGSDRGYVWGGRRTVGD
uniref:Uncharacterized protein n=1 Tax=Desulfobacca acetoxidans TaxID=60893 RepID=A0A7C3UY81_9BACT